MLIHTKYLLSRNYIWDPPIVRFTYTDRKTKKLETAIGKVEGNKLKINEIVYTKQ